MALPDRLAQCVQDAADAVQRDPAHDLVLGHRQAIWAALGQCDTERVAFGPGHQRRAVLALLTADRVLPLWRDARPTEHIAAWQVERADPRRLLAIALRVLHGVEGRASAEYATGDAFRILTGLAEDDGNRVASFTGLSADRALATVLYDERFDPAHRDLSLTDDARDAWTYDAAYFAAGAAADGPPFVPGSDAGKRRAFWVWWLSQAVAMAWGAVDPNGTLLGDWQAQLGHGAAL